MTYFIFVHAKKMVFLHTPAPFPHTGMQMIRVLADTQDGSKISVCLSCLSRKVTNWKANVSLHPLLSQLTKISQNTLWRPENWRNLAKIQPDYRSNSIALRRRACSHRRKKNKTHQAKNNNNKKTHTKKTPTQDLTLGAAVFHAHVT